MTADVVAKLHKLHSFICNFFPGWFKTNVREVTFSAPEMADVSKTVSFATDLVTASMAPTKTKVCKKAGMDTYH